MAELQIIYKCRRCLILIF